MKFTLVTTCLLISGVMYAQPPKFTIQDLGSLPQLDTCTATALSQSGNVVGYCSALRNSSLVSATGNSPAVDAFMFSNGTMNDLNLTTFSTPVPTAVNDSGVVAGAYLNIDLSSGTSAQAFVVQTDGTSQLLQGTLQGLLPFGLINSGQIAGTVFEILSAGNFNFFFNSQALLTTAAGAKPTTLLPPAGTPGKGAAFGLSQANGWVAGASVGPSATSIQATLWQQSTTGGPPTAQILPALANYSQSTATSVNDSGMAAGVAFDMDLTSPKNPVPGSDAHAVLYNNGAVTDLGTLEGDKSSMALGINNSGWVVGVSDNQAPPLGLILEPLLNSVKPGFRAFLYAGGQMYDLSQLVTNLQVQGWQLTYAVQVNNAGQIVGTGLLATGEQHAFLLTPVAAPAGPQITGLGGAGQSVPPVTTLTTNSMFAMYGTAFAASGVSHLVTSKDLVNNALPTNVANTCVEGGGVRWPLLYVSATQINALAGDLSGAGAMVPVSVIANCDTGNDVTSPAVNVPVAASAPEFLYFVPTASGQNPVAAIFAKGPNAGQKVGAPNLIAGKMFFEAHEGDTLTAFGVGWGATTSNEPVGTIATAAASLPAGTYSLTVGGQPAVVKYAGLAPTFAGLYQVNFVVPTGAVPTGQLMADAPLIMTINGVQTPNNGANTPYITVTAQ